MPAGRDRGLLLSATLCGSWASVNQVEVGHAGLHSWGARMGAGGLRMGQGSWGWFWVSGPLITLLLGPLSSSSEPALLRREGGMRAVLESVCGDTQVTCAHTHTHRHAHRATHPRSPGRSRKSSLSVLPPGCPGTNECFGAPVGLTGREAPATARGGPPREACVLSGPGMTPPPAHRLGAGPQTWGPEHFWRE